MDSDIDADDLFDRGAVSKNPIEQLFSGSQGKNNKLKNLKRQRINSGSIRNF